MAMGIPTSTSMKLKFPEFQDVHDMTIEFAIEEALRNVDETWIEKDQTLAMMYYAAHLIVSGIARAESGTGQKIKSESIGRMSISYETLPTNKKDLSNDLSSTDYGIRYLDLAGKSFPSIMVV